MRVWSLRAGLFVSGASGLIYELCWTRMLHQVFGVSDLAVATVLATYFLGLGLGGALGGRYAHRIQRPGRAYAAIEIAIAVLALVSLPLVSAVQSSYASIAAGGSGAAVGTVRGLLAALVLLPPTVMMGATIPVLARTRESDATWSRDVTWLYVANTVGAMAGVALAGFWAVPAVGVRATVGIAAGGSVLAAVIVVAAVGGQAVPAAAAPVSARGRPSFLAPALAFLSGATALAGEVLWTRALRIVVHATTDAFAAMLIDFLAGIAIGAVAAPYLARRLGGKLAFGVVQWLIVPAIGLAMALAPHLPRIVPLVRHELSLVPHEPWMLLAISSLLLLPIAVLTGTGLPLAWSIAAEEQREASSGTGALLAANTLGGLAGSLGVAFVLIPVLGTEASLLLVAVGCALSSALALRAATQTLRARAIALVSPAAVLAIVLLAQPTIDLPFLLASGEAPLEAVVQGPGPAWRRDIVFLQEGRNTTVSVRRSGAGLSLYNDGRPESGFGLGDPGFGPEIVALAALPGLFADERGSAVVVGLGAGHCVSVALAAGFEHVTAIELEPAVVDAARLLYDARGRPFPVDDPRVRLVVDDGRSQISLAETDGVDAVISQPSHPWLAGSAALYTSEFFADVARALRPGGVFALWVNLFRSDIEAIRSILATLHGSFEHVQGLVLGTSLVIAARTAPFDWDRAASRLESGDLRARFLAPHRLATMPALAATLEIDEATARALGEGAPLISDDRPILEYRLARRSHHGSLATPVLDRAIGERPWLSPGASILTSASALAVLEARVELVAARRRALQRVAATASAIEPPSRRAELEGRLAEARGDVGAALDAYARASTPAAALAEDRLRLAEVGPAATLERAVVRGVLPASPEPIVEAALALGDADALGRALLVAERSGAPATPLLSAAREHARGGCAALLEASTLEAAARASARLALVAERCALVMERDDLAGHFEHLAWRRRVIEANELTSQGRAALEGGNGGRAWMLLERALEAYPSSSAASIALATLHHRDGRRAEARQVMIEAWVASEGLPESRQRIAAACESLGLDLRSQGVEVPEDVSSSAPAMRDPPAGP